MMNVKIKRKPSTEYGTFGELFINDTWFFYTIERPNTGEYPCIPEGTYECSRFNSPKNGPCWMLKDVPGRTYIQIHPANLASQLRGCIAPGKHIGELDGIPAVLSSRAAMAELYKLVGDDFTLTVES